MNKKNQKKLIQKIQVPVAVYALTLSLVFYPVSNLLANSKLEETRKNLNQELTKIDDLSKSKQETDIQVRTLSKEIDSLDKEIDSAQKSLDTTNQDIESIQAELSETRAYISTLEQTIRAQKALIREYVSSLYVQKDVSLFEVILSQDQLSDLLGSVQKTGVMQDSITESITLISAKEKEIVAEKKHLFDKEEELMALKQSQERQKSLLQQTQEDKETLLAQTKGQQSEYEALLKESFATKQNLLNSIIVLGGGTDGRPGAISLEEAYALAAANAARLGNKIRPEYLVGVMKIESGLGGNVGRSFYKDSLSGCAAREGNTTKLNFTKEEQAFEKITSALGIPLTQPVSGCPYPKYIGTGGAMGPAQIMPATWLGYESKLRELKGGASVNPWNMEDAMLAMGMVLLGKVGNQSIAGNDELERRAALCYLGGCNVKNMWYADKVLNEAARTKELLGR
jgi:peptidoglycan hydrolase CwlO-like protein